VWVGEGGGSGPQVLCGPGAAWLDTPGWVDGCLCHCMVEDGRMCQSIVFCRTTDQEGFGLVVLVRTAGGSAAGRSAAGGGWCWCRQVCFRESCRGCKHTPAQLPCNSVLLPGRCQAVPNAACLLHTLSKPPGRQPPLTCARHRCPLLGGSAGPP
jgi:hypothetical protein